MTATASSTRPPARRLSRGRAVLFTTVLLFFGLVLLEAACQMAYRFRERQWLWTTRPAEYSLLFREHPYLGVVGRPRVTVTGDSGVTIAHNSWGCRGPEVAATKRPGVTRVVTLGGSTTYCVRLAEDETWPHYLGELLGTRYEVVNLGMPGYSTVENLTQANLWFSDLHPDVAIFYEGWNDIRSSHLKDLRPDYSDYHGPSQKFNLSVLPGPPAWSRKAATLHYAYRAGARAFVSEPDYPEAVRGPNPGPVDARALGLYERNLKLIAASCKAQGIRCVFVPQVMNLPGPADGGSVAWVPLVDARDMGTVLKCYQEAMRVVARDHGAWYAEDLLEEPFTPDDFLDRGHFKASGSRRFAGALAQSLKRAGLITGGDPASR